ncbi:MAG TPA: 4Fe-4S binding protein [Planctomycetota bacterium]|nr:4Fe-4S binding protein [Planctomycetota bacterium]
MTHVVTARCLDCRYTDCCAVCPVEAFHKLDDPAMLVINPATCIDCQLCVPECPVHAIYADNELPAHYAEWKDMNTALAEMGPKITKKEPALAGAATLEQMHAKERAAGWTPVEPSGAP